MAEQIVVIGGGLAGCTAALALARAAQHKPFEQRPVITLVESKSRLGGRVGSYTDQSSGQRIDYCQHVGMGCCTALKQLIHWLGQEDQWRTQRELYFYGPEQQRQCLRALPLLPAPFHLASWLWNWPGLSWLDRFAIARGMLAINRIPLTGPRAEQLDQLSAQQWLTSQGQSPQVLERFWSTIVVSALGEQLDRVGLLPMAKVFQDGFLRRRDAYHLLIPQRPLDDLFGQQFYAALSTLGVQVRLSTSVHDTHWDGATCHRLMLSTGETIEPTSLIAAVPWHAVSDVVRACPDLHVRSIADQAGSLASSPISGVHTWWDRPWLPTPHAVLVGRLCQWIFPHVEPRGSELTGGVSTAEAERLGGGHYYQIVISASHRLPRGDAAEVGRLIEADLQTVFPEARSAQLLRTRVVTDPKAVFSVGPGTQAMRVDAGRRDGNLIWAGDWTRTGWPSTMESAIRSGLAAASEMMPLVTRHQP